MGDQDVAMTSADEPSSPTAAVATSTGEAASTDAVAAVDAEMKEDGASTNDATGDSTGDANNDDDDDSVDSEDDDTTSTDSSDDDDDDKAAPKEDPELLLLKAANHKEAGNGFFKEKDFEKAARSYRRGVNALKSLNKANTGDDQVKALLISLQTNLSMMCFKMTKYKQSMTVASRVLQIDANNVKARYRRAAAHRKLGNSDEARADLKEALRLDPNNMAVKKELMSLKKEVEAAKKAQKKGLQKAFAGKSGSFLYDDKEEEKKRKEAEKKLEEQRKKEAEKKRKVDWENECVKRMAQGEQAISYEDWDKERKAAEKKAKKKQEKEEKRLEAERRKARKAASAAAKKDDSDSDDDKLTEAELAQFRGYKKTADGRVTSYFSREQSEQEKSLIGSIAPKRLESNVSDDSFDNNNNDTEASPSAASGGAACAATPSGGAAKGSAWNQAGTWEEKDTTDWCRKQLKARLKQTKAESDDSVVAQITKVKDMKGDASVAVVSAKKRYIFDFHCQLEFQITKTGDDDVLASGTLHLPDICSTHHEELEVTIQAWKESPSPEHQALATESRLALCSEVRESVKLWVQDFNQMY